MRECLLVADVAPLSDAQLFRRAYDALPPERREKVDRMRMARDRRLSIGAGLLLREALTRSSVPADEMKFVIGENGKPSLAGAHGIRFNLSHAGHFALCAVSCLEVGCDIERVADADLRVADRFFTPSECEAITSQTTKSKKNVTFYRLWTLKESFLKVTGQGLRLPLSSFEIALPPPDTQSETPRIRQNPDAHTYCFREYGDTIPGYRIAVCTADGEFSAAPEILEVASLV